VTTDPLPAFAELGRINLADNDLNEVLSRVAELCRTVIPGADEVSVTLITAGVPGTAVFTGDVALRLDQAQYVAGRGPCLDAAEARDTRVVADMATEARWPLFTASAKEHGMQSSLSVGLPIRDNVTGALNMYSATPHSFDEEAVALASTFAGYAAVAMANAHLYSTTAALADQMAQAMTSRAAIEQAKGILMAQRGCSADQAFQILSRASQVSNRKLRDVAQDIVAGTSHAG
jgi:GAF domain-containing protein